MPLTAIDLSTKAKFFRGLSDPSRLSVLESLRDGPRSVGEIVEATGLTQSNTSNHLACLLDCGLVSRDQRGRFAFYELADKRVDAILDDAEALIRDVAVGVVACRRYEGRPEEVRPRKNKRKLTILSVVLAVATLAVVCGDAATQEGGRSFGNDAFARVHDAVVESSPALAAARASVDAGRLRAQGAGFAPPMVLSAEIDEIPNGIDVSDASARVEVGRELIGGARSAAARALASAEVGIAESSLRALEREIRGRVVVGLTRLAAARLVSRRLAAEDTLLTGAQAAVTDRFAVGRARYVDVLRVQTETLRVRTEIGSALAAELAAVEEILGLAAPDAREPIVAMLDDPGILQALAQGSPLPDVPSVASLVALSRPATIARAEELRARAARDLTFAETRTRFALFAGAQKFSEPGRTWLGPVLGGSITLPFTSGRANVASQRAAEREVEAAQGTVTAAETRARGLIAAEIARYEAARERFEVYDDALLAAASDARESALGAYRTGDLTLLELLDFERAVATSEIERVRALAAAVEAYTNLVSGSVAAGTDAQEE